VLINAVIGEVELYDIGYRYSTSSGGFQVRLARKHRVEALRGFPSFGELGGCCRSPFGGRPYTIRVRVPHGVKLMPHRHPEDLVYTVVSGVFYIGLDGEFDPDKLEAYPPCSVIVLPDSVRALLRSTRQSAIQGKAGVKVELPIF
jgi:hypothetical protein